MGNLPAHLHDVPLYDIAIPGTHDSGTSDLSSWKGVGSDKSRELRCIMTGLMCLCCCFFTSFLKSWNKCQRLNFYQQLCVGVRFFDMRVTRYAPKLFKKGKAKRRSPCAKHSGETESRQALLDKGSGCKPGEDLHTLHILYGGKIRNYMEEIKQFLTEHRREVVLLDFNHFYDMDADNHRDLAHLLKDVFGPLLCPYSPDTPLDDLTLSNLWTSDTRVIVFYHQNSEWLPEECAVFWPAWAMDSQSSWANTMELDRWRRKQEAESDDRHSGNTFYVCQGVLTPDVNYISKTCCCSFFCCCCERGVKTECADRINPGLPAWMEEDVKRKGARRRVIYMADFVDEEYDGRSFVQSVIELNR
ncbi:PI-PLC X domain-containing protein 3-like isoform X2 [Babylonia areolata]